ncbi:MAG: baseplate J/gp47 family protein [Anaerolineae bacterium]|nr:baseplate J/gp47 family protein [Anaerolineae bacterium]
MPERPEFIQLEEGDDVPSVRDRLSFHHRKQVLLIWPEKGTVLMRKLDLVLIQRDALRRGIRLALVTHDPQVIRHASELNISTFETIGASERARWKRGRTGVFSNRLWRPKKDTPDPDELMSVASRVRGETEREPLLRRLLMRLLLLAVVAGAVFALAYILLPGATVVLIPAQNRVDVEVPVTADLNARGVDIENAIIPATLLSVTIEETGTIQTSGQQRLADVPAQGSVVFVNQTSSDVAIPAGTNLSTSAGTPILFHTTEAATVPAGVGQQIEIPIEALPASAGDIGNVPSGLVNTIVGDLANRVTVRNINPTFGGASQSLAAVTQDDQDRLLAVVRQQLQSRAYVEMLPRLEDTQFLILETVHIAEERSDWTTFSAQPGDAADTLTLTMRAVVEATAIDEQFGQQIAFANIAGQIPRGREILPETLVYTRGPVNNIFQNGQVAFTLEGTGLVVGQIDTEFLRGRIAGMTVQEAATYMQGELDLLENTAPQITLSPDWFGRMPLLPFRINLIVAEPTA